MRARYRIVRDFVRTAILRQLESRADAVPDTVARRALMPGKHRTSAAVTWRTSRRGAGRQATRPRGGDVCLKVAALGAFGVNAALATGTTTDPSHRAGRAVDVNITTHPGGLPWMATAPPICRQQ